MSEKIVELYFERDEQAITETRKLYGKLINSIAMGVLNSREEAGEIESDTYMQLWSTIPPMRPNNLKAYACKIARNLSINRLKYLTADKRCPSEFDVIFDELSEVIPSKENVEEAAEGSALGSLFSEFLHGLPQDSRMIFIKRYWQFMPCSEIARDMHCSLTRVNSSLHRTRLRLRRFLNERGYRI